MAEKKSMVKIGGTAHMMRIAMKSDHEILRMGGMIPAFMPRLPRDMMFWIALPSFLMMPLFMFRMVLFMRSFMVPELCVEEVDTLEDWDVKDALEGESGR
jgi:hypothetical protein